MEQDNTEDVSEESTESIVEEAKERFERAKDMYSASRAQAVADTRFALGDSDNLWQWPEDVATSRQGDRRVCLTVNLTAQHCNQIINQIRQNRPSCRVMPVDDMSDKKTAEILAGLIRNIQTTSNADDAHDTAAEHAIYGGEGYWRVITEFESDSSFNQIIKIKACPNPQLVYIDPDAVEPDKSDAEWGFIFEDVKKDTIEREYPELKGELSSWVEDKKYQWVSEDTVRVAEYFYVEYVKDTALLLADGSSTLESTLPENVTRKDMKLVNSDTGESIEIIKERDTFRKQWKWCKLVGGHDKPYEERDWPGAYLPIIATIGKEVNVNGQVIRKGIVRDLKDPARMVNYSYSETVQTLALQNKVPYMASAEAIEGFEGIWGNANLENRAYLPYNSFDEAGQPLQPPQRQPPAIMPAAQVQLLQLSTEEMRGASGQQNSNFGIKSEASSGVGIQRLKQQGEIATFHFPDNHARGLRYEAKILIDLIPKVMDTKQIVRVLGLDGKQEQATLDPSHQNAYYEQDIGDGDIQKIFNPTIGQYDVVIDTGPSFQTQRQEAFATLSDMSSRNPALIDKAGDLIMRNSDYPGADQIADRLEKFLPPEVRDQKNGAAQQLQQATQAAQQMQQQLQQMQQVMQEMQQKLQAAESGQAKAQMEIQAKMQLSAAEIEAKKEMALLDAQVQDQKHQREIAARQQQAEIEAQIKQQTIAMEIQARQQQADADAKFKKEQTLVNAHLSIDAAEKDACAKVKMAQMEIESREDIAELNAYVELKRAGIDNPDLTADVTDDLKEDDTNSLTIIADSQ